MQGVGAVHGSVEEIGCLKSGNSSSGDTDLIRAENQDAQTGSSVQERVSRDITALP